MAPQGHFKMNMFIWLCLFISGLHAIENEQDAIAAAGKPKPKPKPQLTVSTTEGKILGQVLYESRVWRGIRYGDAPVGEWRWKDARDPPKFKDVQEQFNFGSSCVQPTDEFTVSEDCLFLNVYSPLSPPSGRDGLYMFYNIFFW